MSFFYLLSGRHPFQTDDLLELIHAHTNKVIKHLPANIQTYIYISISNQHPSLNNTYITTDTNNHCYNHNYLSTESPSCNWICKCISYYGCYRIQNVSQTTRYVCIQISQIEVFNHLYIYIYISYPLTLVYLANIYPYIEDRYQSTYGLRRDLERLQQLKKQYPTEIPKQVAQGIHYFLYIYNYLVIR